MKKLEVRCIEESRDSMVELLSKYDLTYSTHEELRTEAGSEHSFVFSIVLPDELLDAVMTEVSNLLDMRRSDNQIIVTDILGYISTKLEKMREKYGKAKVPNPLEIVVQPLESYLKPSIDLILLMIISTTVALAGLFLNNSPILVGSMILAPLLGPINAVTANSSLGRLRKVGQAESVLFLLVFVSLVTSVALTAFLSLFVSLPINPAITSRTFVTPFDLIVALALGVAGALAMATKLPEALVGVAVAAALVPPLGVAGISLATGQWDMFYNSFLLTMTYLFGLKVGGLVTLILKGFTPRKYWEASKARKHGIRTLLLFLAILIILFLLIIIQGI